MEQNKLAQLLRMLKSSEYRLTYIVFMVTADDAVRCNNDIGLANRMHTFNTPVAMMHENRQLSTLHARFDFMLPLIDQGRGTHDQRFAWNDIEGVRSVWELKKCETKHSACQLVIANHSTRANEQSQRFVASFTQSEEYLHI